MKKFSRNRRIAIKTTLPTLLVASLWVCTSLTTVSADDTSNASTTDESSPQVTLVTNVGEITLELFPEKAPESVKNFLQYVEDGFYSGTIFHRVIDGFMIQGGGYTKTFDKKETRPSIQNEADNGLENLKLTVAMARTQAPHSATAQFFINTADNDFLNHRAKNTAGWGYTVFGKVVKGQEIAEWIGKAPTGPGGPFPKDVPQGSIVIQEAIVVGATVPAE